MSDRGITKRYLGITEHKPKPRLSNMYKDVLLNEVLGNIKDPYAKPIPLEPEPVEPEKQQQQEPKQKQEPATTEFQCPWETKFIEFFKKMRAGCQKRYGENAQEYSDCLERICAGGQGAVIEYTLNNVLNEEGWSELITNLAAGDSLGSQVAASVKRYVDPDGEHLKAFEQYVTSGDERLVFPEDVVSPQTGNLYNMLDAIPGKPLSKELVADVMHHTGQDEGKRGIGKAEVGMTMFFSNVSSSTGKGDLSVSRDGTGEPGEFEIKGHMAALGARGDEAHVQPKERDVISMLGFTKVAASNYEVGGKQFKEFAEAISHAYKISEDQEKYKEMFWEFLKEKGGFGLDTEAIPNVKKVFDMINLDKPRHITTGIPYMNFVRYATVEGFQHFMVHDCGAPGKLKHKGKDPSGIGVPSPSSPGNTGLYLFASGDPLEMAKQLFASDILGWEKVAFNNVRPKIGLTPYGTTDTKPWKTGGEPIRQPVPDRKRFKGYDPSKTFKVGEGSFEQPVKPRL